MNAHTDSLLLRRALLGNAAFSTLTGLTLLIGGGWLGPALGLPAIALRVVGLVLLPFALGLVKNARRERVDRTEAWVTVAMDLAWVAGSALLVFGDVWPLLPAGTWTVVAVADIVMAFALLQAIGLKRSAPEAVPVAGSDLA